MSMRIGLGITVWARGLQRQHLDGIGVYTRNLWQNLETLGCDLQGLRMGGCDIPAHELPSRQTCLPGKISIYAAFSSLTGLPTPHSGGFEQRIDLFHAPDHHIPKLRKVPILASVMDTIPFSHPEWVSNRLQGFKRFAFKRSAHWCERIITISEHSKRDITEYLAIPEDRIDVVPLGVDAQFFRHESEESMERALAKYGARRGSFIFVSTIQPRKNLRRLIEAHRRLPPHVQQEHPLLIIGKYGWGDDELPALLSSLKENGQGVWLNNVPDSDLRPMLQSALALVYPSLYEGFGLPILEGFASGIPVISSNGTSIPEVTGNAALLIDPCSEDELAAAMLKLAEDSGLRRLLASRGLERAKMFTWRHTAEKTLAVYRQFA